ncbi:UNVERIFIED_CONTAM: hypothetical protein ABID98_005638 [Brevibacillus sp. OAP136]
MESLLCDVHLYGKTVACTAVFLLSKRTMDACYRTHSFLFSHRFRRQSDAERGKYVFVVNCICKSMNS